MDIQEGLRVGANRASMTTDTPSMLQQAQHRGRFRAHPRVKLEWREASYVAKAAQSSRSRHARICMLLSCSWVVQVHKVKSVRLWRCRRGPTTCLTSLGQRRQRPAWRRARAGRKLRGSLSRHGGCELFVRPGEVLVMVVLLLLEWCCEAELGEC